MPLPVEFKVSFDQYKKDLIAQALDRMLSQHYDKCVLRQFTACFIQQCQELYDACIDLQRLRTPYEAEEINLDALGRIVGEERDLWEYDESYYMFFDREGQGFDQNVMWCINAPIGVAVPVDDLQYKMNIIVKAIKNHTLTSSIPEMTDLINLALETTVSFDKIGPNEVQLIVPAYISATNFYILIRSFDDEQVDHRFWMPYPATLDIKSTIFAPDGWFMFDVWEREEEVITPGNWFVLDNDDKTFDLVPMWVQKAIAGDVTDVVKFTDRAWDIAPIAVGVPSEQYT